MKKAIAFLVSALISTSAIMYFVLQSPAAEMPKALVEDALPCESKASDCLENAAIVSDEELLDTPRPISEDALSEIEKYWQENPDQAPEAYKKLLNQQ